MTKFLHIDLTDKNITEAAFIKSQLRAMGVEYHDDAQDRLIKPRSFDFELQCVNPDQYNKFEQLPEFAVVKQVVLGYYDCDFGEGMSSDTALNILTATILNQLDPLMQKRIKGHLDQYNKVISNMRDRMHHLIKDFNSLTSENSTASIGRTLTQAEMENGYTAMGAEELAEQMLRESYENMASKMPPDRP